MTSGRLFAALALTTALAACAGTAATPTPTVTPGASPTPSLTQGPTASPTTVATVPVTLVTSATQAAAVVLASDPHFASVRPGDPDLIGLCCTYQAVDAAPGYTVTVNIDWGDCPAGCINHHQWQFQVARDGTVAQVAESGTDDPPLPQGEGVTAAVTVHLLAGPTCPVAHVPPDPGCAARPVANADVVVRNPAGQEIARATSDAQGLISLQLPPAAYYVEPQPATGLMGTAPAFAFSVVGGETVDFFSAYDTGIR